MASSRDTAAELSMDNPDKTEAWLRVFSAKCRHKKLCDTDDSKEITDFFIATAGLNAIQQVTTMVKPYNLEDMNFANIEQIIKEKIRPKKKLIIAERAHFMQINQMPGESISDYAQRLRKAAQFCEFNNLGTAEASQTSEDELLQMRLVDGLYNKQHKVKLLEFFQTSATNDMILEACVQFVQQLEIIEKFNKESNGPAEMATDSSVAFVDKKRAERENCKWCGTLHEPRKCPAYGKTCNKCKKKIILVQFADHTTRPQKESAFTCSMKSQQDQRKIYTSTATTAMR